MHGWDGWWMGGMVVWMTLFWGAVLLGVVWLIRGNMERRPRGHEGALEILDRRLAEGTISVDEYRQTKATLTGE